MGEIWMPLFHQEFTVHGIRSSVPMGDRAKLLPSAWWGFFVMWNPNHLEFKPLFFFESATTQQVKG